MFHKLLLAALAAFIYGGVAAQPNLPKTFLWRITGNHLSQPSYLYGTMHLQDRELFNFGDSIYHALEASDGFAIELNPSEMMDTLFKLFALPDNSPLIKDVLSKEQYEKVAGKLSKKLKMPADQITTKKIEDERRNWLSKTRKKNDMPTFMDMYFYTIAQNQGKYVGGIEDLEDQLGLLDEAGASDIENYVEESNESRLKMLNEMKGIYKSSDLEKIGRFSHVDSTPSLIKRNVKMARRLDSLSHIRNTFFAVGAAHLPGDSGLLALLKGRGFNVEPVMSSRLIKPDEYHYTKKEIRWIVVPDDHKISSVEMPGQPSVVNLSGVIPMNMYLDLSNTFCYGSAVIPMLSESNEDSVYAKLAANFKSQGAEIYSTRKTVEHGAKVIEFTMKNDGFLRFKLFIKSNKLFMLIFGVQDKEKLKAAEGDRFLNSLTINDTALVQQTVWRTFTDEGNGFSISLPADPQSSFEKGTARTLFDAYTYTASDFSDGSYYLMLVKNSIPGYYILSDSTIFEEYKKNFLQSGEAKILNVADISDNGFRGKKMLLQKKEKDKFYTIQLRMLFRGNRIYMPLVVTENGREDSGGPGKYFNSFSYLPLEQAKWEQRLSPDSNFIAWAPQPFLKTKIDTLSLEEPASHTFIATDKGNAVDYSVETQAFSKYYWTNSDSSFFKKISMGFYSPEDSLMSYEKLKGDIPGAETIIKMHNSAIYKRLRTLLNGDTLYTLYSFYPKELMDDKNQRRFFEDFKFIHANPTTLFTNKQSLLLSALLSTDSATRSNATEVLNNIDFIEKDLPFLHKAWLSEYPVDANKYRSTNYSIGEKIAVLHDSLTLDFIEKNYSKMQTAPAELQMNMLEVLADFKTRRSYALMKKLLLTQPPATGSVYSFSNALSDSLFLAKDLFPEVARLYADSILGGALVKLTGNLIDSNIIRIDEISGYVPLVYSLAKKQLAELENNATDYPDYNFAVIKLLEKINTTEAAGLLKSFVNTRNVAVRYDAALGLARLNKSVPEVIMNSIAANRAYRTELYFSLKEMGKSTLFPKGYLTPQKFAESYVFNYAIEDEDSIRLEAKGSKTIKVDGNWQQYFLFKVNTVYDEETTSYLAVCGPFEDKKIPEKDENAIRVRVFYEEEYNPANTDKLFQQFIDPPGEKVSE